MADPEYRALLIGNSTFPDDPHNLQDLEGPRNDIHLLRSAFTDPIIGLFESDAVRLVPERAMKDIMIELDRFFDSATKDTRLLLYYSGHGLLDQANQLYLCARDTVKDRFRATAVSGKAINSMIDASPARATVIILDCCHSGAFKGGDLGYALRGTGRFHLTSSRSGQLSNDADQRNHASVFTSRLVEGIQGSAADQNHDGFISLSELYNYVHNRLEAEGKQIPQRYFSGGGDVPIARRRAQGLVLSRTSIVLNDVELGEKLAPERIYVRSDKDSPWRVETTADWINIEHHTDSFDVWLHPRLGINRASVVVRDPTSGETYTVAVTVRTHQVGPPPKPPPPEPPQHWWQRRLPGNGLRVVPLAAALVFALLAGVVFAVILDRQRGSVRPGSVMTADQRIFTVAFSPDGRSIATGSTDENVVRIWTVATERNTAVLKGHTKPIFRVAFSPTGAVASASSDKTVRLWDLASAKTTVVLRGHKDSVYSVAFSTDGTTLATGGRDWEARLWNIASRKSTAVLAGHKHVIGGIAFSPDGRMLATGSNDETARLWSAATGRALGTLEDHAKEIHSVAFSPDSATLATGSADGTARLWDVTSGSTIKTFTGHSGAVYSVAFSPDGATLATGSADGTARLWDVTNGSTIKTFTGHSRGVYSVAFSPDGETLASGSADRTLRLWHARAS